MSLDLPLDLQREVYKFLTMNRQKKLNLDEYIPSILIYKEYEKYKTNSKLLEIEEK